MQQLRVGYASGGLRDRGASNSAEDDIESPVANHEDSCCRVGSYYKRDRAGIGAFIIFLIPLAKGGFEFAVTQQAKASLKRLAPQAAAKP